MKIHEHGELVLLDMMGSDDAIADAARVSYHPASTKQKGSKRDLIRYLMRHRHTSPFEMVEFKFYVKQPIFVTRQWIRHRTANVNEMSGRYSVMPTEFFSYDEYNRQSTINKQGRSSEATHDSWPASVLEHTEVGFRLYEEMVEADVSREQARIHLPLSTYTELVWKIDLHNLFHFLKLRTDGHAQKEIRDYAAALESIVAEKCPLAHEAWCDYSKNAYTLSAAEVELVKIMARCSANGDQDDQAIASILERMTVRERNDFAAIFPGE